MLLQLIIFKLLYPYADFFSDSYSYMYAAANHQSVSIWPIGYAKFIGLFHKITYSDTTLVVFQYLFVQVMTLYLFYSIIHFYSPSRLIRNTLFIFSFCNPLILYICNYISSDGLFLGLSLLWLTQILWIVNSPHPYQIILHSLVVVLAFMVRYNAMYYPLITALAFLLSRHKSAYKVTGIVLPLLLIAVFVNHTRGKSYEVTGTKQFSVFGGWQLANNALYMYPYIQVQEPIPAACRKFHEMVKSYFSSIPEQLKAVSPIEGAFYIKFSKGPLKQYLAQQVDERKDTTDGVASWGVVAPVFSEYGSFLIRQHPVAFAEYFLWPNTYNYWLPPLEKLEVYNLGEDHVGSIAKYWFHYPHHKIRAISFTGQGTLLGIFPTFFLFINIIFIGCLIWWLFSKGIQKSEKLFGYIILLATAFLLVNAAFGILASPIVFRYQVFPMITCFAFSLLLIGRLEILLSPK